MNQPSVIPVVKALYLCDGHIAFPHGKTDLVGIFNAIRPKTYPHVQATFVVFAQLHSGLGRVPFFIDIREASGGQLIGTSTVHILGFARRSDVIQLAYTMKDCRFPRNGTYLIELFCSGQWVADTALQLL